MWLPLTHSAKARDGAVLTSPWKKLARAAGNSISTLFSYDLWKRFKPATPDHKLVTIGRIAAVCAMFIASSLAMPKKPGEDPEHLYLKSLGDCLAFKGWPVIGNYRFLAAFVIAIMVILYYVFR